MRPLVAMALVVVLSLPARGATIDAVLAVVNGKPITSSDLAREEAFIAATGLAPVELRLAGEAGGLLDQMILAVLIRQRAADRGISVGEGELSATLDRIAAGNRLTREALQRQLTESGVAWDRFADRITSRMIEAELVDREVLSRVVLDDREVEEEYRKEKRRYLVPLEVGVRHLLIPLAAEAPAEEVRAAEELAAALKRRVAAGEDFADLARAYSKDGSAASGGDLGMVRRGQLLPELEGAILALREGEIGGPIRTPAGLHLVLVTERREEHYTPFEQAKDALAKEIGTRKTREGIQAFFAALRKEAFIRYPRGNQAATQVTPR